MKLFRSKLLLCTLLGAICCSDGMGAGWKQERLEQVRGALPGNRLYRRALKVLSAQCDSLLTTANPSVMMKECVPASGDRHDYTSLARYYWPDPATADGFPYVRRDGETNPDVDRYDRNRVMEFAGGVYALAVGYWLTDDARYGEKARDMIRTWYLDEATRMNPNLTYSQMIPGRNGGMGRPMGIIDTYLMIDVVDAAQLLEAKGVLAAEEMEALRDWFSELVDWMLTAPNARKIARHGNNLGVAYDAQLIRYALFAGRPEIARRTLESFPARRLAVQVEPDGSMPQELRRTRAPTPLQGGGPGRRAGAPFSGALSAGSGVVPLRTDQRTPFGAGRHGPSAVARGHAVRERGVREALRTLRTPLRKAYFHFVVSIKKKKP